MRNLLALLLLATLTFTSCQKKTEKQEESTDDTAETMVQKQYTLTPFSGSYEFPDADLQAMSYKKGTFKFEFSGYDLGQQTPDAAQKMCANCW